MEKLDSHSNLPLRIVKAVGSFILERHEIVERGGGPMLDSFLDHRTEGIPVIERPEAAQLNRWDSMGDYLSEGFLE